MNSKPRGRPPVENPSTAQIHVRATPEDKGRYERAAGKRGLTLSGWIKAVLDRASRR
jgi:hypothetical protein